MQYISNKQFFDDSEIIIHSKYEEFIMGRVMIKRKSEFKVLGNNKMYWDFNNGSEKHEFIRDLI